jgi:hypothetical protein
VGASLVNIRRNKLRIDTLETKERAKYAALVAAEHGDVVALKYFDVVETEERVLVSPEQQEVPGHVDEEGAVIDKGIPYKAAVYDTRATAEVVEVKREYYVGSATLGTIGKIIQLASVAFARGSSMKAENGVTHNIPFVEAFTEAGLLSEFVGAILREDDTKWLEDHVNFDSAGDVVIAFMKHNDFFGILEKVMGVMETLSSKTSKLKLTEESARNALLGSLAAKS